MNTELHSERAPEVIDDILREVSTGNGHEELGAPQKSPTR
jgi:hypothetical protein